MAKDLTRIGERARRDPKAVFTSIYHFVKDVDLLRDCYRQTGKKKAPGVDGVTKQEYGRNLEANLRDLSERLGRMGYRPKPVLRQYIPKPGTDKKRPLGLPCFEDKIVQKALARVLEQIYEADFLECSHGYRPGRTQHQALKKLGQTIQRRKVSWVVDADIKGFLETASYCTPVHEGLSKRVTCASITLIRRPLRLPRRTWTAASSPRFTRCNTV